MESLYFHVAVKDGVLSAVRICGVRSAGNGGCCRPWGHYGDHMDQQGYTWEYTQPKGKPHAEG